MESPLFTFSKVFATHPGNEIFFIDFDNRRLWSVKGSDVFNLVEGHLTQNEIEQVMLIAFECQESLEGLKQQRERERKKI